jgi:hypothetical protein
MMVRMATAPIARRVRPHVQRLVIFRMLGIPGLSGSPPLRPPAVTLAAKSLSTVDVLAVDRHLHAGARKRL